MKEFRVGVFAEQRARSVCLSAYTVWFDPNWTDCCVHTVTANNGSEAKFIAKQQHRENCMAPKIVHEQQEEEK